MKNSVNNLEGWFSATDQVSMGGLLNSGNHNFLIYLFDR